MNLRLNSPTLLLLAAVVPVFVLLFGVIPYTYSHLEYGSQLVSVGHALWIMWNMFPDYQFGMLVPFLTVFVIFRQRQELTVLPIAGWWPGLAFVVAVLALYWAGRRVDNQYIGFFSIQLLLISLVLWLLGFVAFHVGGGLIHLLLVIAVVVIVFQLITGRRAL